MKDLQELTEKLKETSSINEKKALLGQYPQCKGLLRWTYDPFKQFFISSKNILKNPHIIDILSHHRIEELLNALNKRETTGHNAIGACNAFIRNNHEYKGLILDILDKDLGIRVGASIINQVWESLIPAFKVALANKYETFSHKIDYKERWFVSRKLDGVRIITIIDNKGKIAFYSRTGKVILTLAKIEASIGLLGLKNKVFDGEMCIVNNDKEDFTAIISQIRKKDSTVENPIYKVFDYLDIDEFEKKEGKKPFSERLDTLNRLKLAENIEKVAQFHINSEEGLQKRLEYATRQGWEGLMMRKDAGYKGKRSNDILKLKKFHDAEYKVLDIEVGPFRIVKDGREETIQTMTNVLIEHKGHKVSVGSGFSLQERQDFKENPAKIVGKVMTVQYFEETTNKEGGTSLRFPVKKALYKKRDI